MRNEGDRLGEAACTGLGRSPPAEVCRLSDSSGVVYHTTVRLLKAVREGRERGSAELAEAHPPADIILILNEYIFM